MPSLFERIQTRKIINVLSLTPFDMTTSEGRSKERYRRILLNTFSGFLSRLVAAIAGLLTVPIILSYLGKETYGLWTTVTSAVVWVTLFDFGIVNGLVNSISEAYGRNDKEAASAYVSTAFFLLIPISIIVGITTGLLLPIVSWNKVLAVGELIDPRSLQYAILAATLPILIGIPFSIVRQIYSGYQKTYIGNIFTSIGSLLTLGALSLAINLKFELPILAAISVGSNSIVAIINLVYISHIEMRWLRPRLARFSLVALRRLLSTSIPLFLFQIGSLMVNQTQVIVLAHRTNLGIVTEFNVITRLYQTFMSVITTSTIAIVPPFREAFERGDHEWTRINFRRMLYIRMALAFGVSILMIFGGNLIITIWLQRSDISYEYWDWIALSILMLSATWVTAYSDILVIMDRIWVQVILVIFNGLTILLATYILSPHLGVLGAIIATSLFTFIVLTWLVPSIAGTILHKTLPDT